MLARGCTHLQCTAEADGTGAQHVGVLGKGCAPFSSFRMKPTTSHFTLPAAHPSLWLTPQQQHEGEWTRHATAGMTRYRIGLQGGKLLSLTRRRPLHDGRLDGDERPLALLAAQLIRALLRQQFAPAACEAC